MKSWTEILQTETAEKHSGREYRITIEARLPGGDWLPLAVSGTEVLPLILDGFLVIGHKQTDENTECIPILSQDIKAKHVERALRKAPFLMDCAKKATFHAMAAQALGFDPDDMPGMEGAEK